MPPSADNIFAPEPPEPGDDRLIMDPATRAALLRMVRTSYELDSTQRQQWADWAAGQSGFTEMLALPWADLEPAILEAHRQLATLTKPEIHAAVLLLIAGQRLRDARSTEPHLDFSTELALIDLLQSAHLLPDESLHLLLQMCAAEVAAPSSPPRRTFFSACLPTLCLERLRRDQYMSSGSRRLIGAAWMALDRITASDPWWDIYPH